MCKYCRSATVVGNSTLIDIDLNLGALGATKLVGHIAQYNEGAYIDLSFDQYGLYSNSIRRVRAIEYCPICGTKLKKERRELHDRPRVEQAHLQKAERA